MLIVFLGLLTIAGLGVAGDAIWVLDVAASAPDVNSLKPASDGANTKVYDANGDSLGYVQSDILRTPVKLKEIPKPLQQATISIEDEHFYEHNGIDVGAIARAAIRNFEAGSVQQGASTITQQLVRNLFIKDPADTYTRKIQEAKMAMDYEKQHTKKQILGQYLNTAPYGTTDGRSAIGVEAASEVFFDKSVQDLGLREEALLAGLPQAPSEYNPFSNPRAATDRRNRVLDAMASQGYITAAKAAKVKKDGLGLQRGYRYEQRDQQYFFDFVQDELIKKYGLRTVRQGGLKVYTSLDPTLQAAAQTAIAAHPTPTASNALVSIDTHTGEILAMASSQAYDTSQFNLAAQGERQPGSSFKPFVLTAAVDQGIDPDKTYYPAPSSITLNPDPYTSWQVSGGTGGSINLRQATAGSVNVVFAQLGIDVGPQNFDDMAHKLGVTSELDNYYAEALGGTTNCCTVLEMADAYATLADGGVHHDPTAIKKVVFPNGKVDKPESGDGKRVISDGVAYTVADVMRGPLEPGGTAPGAQIPCPASGKTGTTTEQADAWFVGYTPDVSTAVWTGHPNDRTPLPGYGADLSAPIWHDYMLAYINETGNCNDYPKPKDPAQLSAYSSSQTSSSSSSGSTDSTSTDSTTGSTTGGVDANGDGYPDNAYAPGVDAPPPGKTK